MHPDRREIGAEGGLHLAAHRVGQWSSAARSEPERPGLDRKRPARPWRCTAPCRAAKAGAGGPGGRATKASAGGPGGRPEKALVAGGAALLARICGGAATFGWTDASFGWPPRNDPWITFAVTIRSLLIRPSRLGWRRAHP
jgi:hypothetical protein